MSPGLPSTGYLLRLGLLIALGIGAIFIEAAPLGLAPLALPSPDFLFCVIAYWSIRRPKECPLGLVFALGLMRDLITDVPPGIGFLCLVFASNALKAYHPSISPGNLVLECLAVSMAAFLMLALEWTMVFLLLTQPPYLLDMLHQWLFTVLAYLVMIPILRGLLRVAWQRNDPRTGF